MTNDSDSLTKKNNGRLFLRLIIGLSSLITVLIGVLVAMPQTWAVGTTGGLIGEEMIDSHDKARDYADRAIAEAYSIWSERNWQVMYNESNLVVEARRVTEGSFSKSSIVLTRAEGLVKGANAEQLYEFLTSPEGFALIDPGSDPEDFSKYVERIPDWRAGQARLEVAEAYATGIPLAWERMFVVLNSFLPEERIFVSKSVVHKDRPGSSVYYEGGNSGNNGKRIRALNSFALQVEPGMSEDVVVLKMINYIDIYLWHDALSNWVACKAFFPDLFGRLQNVIESEPHLVKNN